MKKFNKSIVYDESFDEVCLQLLGKHSPKNDEDMESHCELINDVIKIVKGMNNAPINSQLSAYAFAEWFDKRYDFGEFKPIGNSMKDWVDLAIIPPFNYVCKRCGSKYTNLKEPLNYSNCVVEKPITREKCNGQLESF